MNKIKIGILGMGTVGNGVYKVLEENKMKIRNLLGNDVEVKKVLVRDINKERSVNLPKEILTTKIEDIIKDPEINIVVEVMGGINPAYDYIKASIKNGKHIVTANKALLASYGEELTELASSKGVELKFEASVGGIPVINTLIENLSVNEIEEIVGIVNGTANFILTQMSTNRLSFEDALRQAQEKGYAEADPSSDIEGDDTVFKLAILTAVAFGIRIQPHKIPKEGITKISLKDIEYAEKLGYKIKLLAVAKKERNHLELYVHPTLIPNNHPLALVNNEFNALFIKGNTVGELMMYGKGAGSLPTASAVVGDIINVCKSIKMKNSLDICTKKDSNKLYILNEDIKRYYVRMEVVDKPEVLGKIALTLGKYGISIDSVVQRARGEKTVPVVFITHEIKRSDLEKSLKEIQNYKEVIDINSILKVENF